jgi:hypothetical protein
VIGTHEDDGYMGKGPIDYNNDEYLLWDIYEDNRLDKSISSPNGKVAVPNTTLVHETNKFISLGSDTYPEEILKKYISSMDFNNPNGKVAVPATTLVHETNTFISLESNTDPEEMLKKYMPSMDSKKSKWKNCYTPS